MGEQVGMAQRMESVARPRGVTLSESTARLLGDGVALGEPELVEIKGGEAPVLVRPLLGMTAGSEPRGRVPHCPDPRRTPNPHRRRPPTRRPPQSPHQDRLRRCALIWSMSGFSGGSWTSRPLVIPCSTSTFAN